MMRPPPIGSNGAVLRESRRGRTAQCRRVATALLAGSLVGGGGIRPAAGGVIASECFAYSAGSSIHGANGDAGWAGSWLTGQAGSYGILAASLTSGLGSSGGALRYSSLTPGGLVLRQLNVAAGSPAAVAGLVELHTAKYFGTISGIGRVGTTMWLGVVFRGESAGDGASGHAALIHLYDGVRSDPASLVLGNSNTDGEALGIGRGNAAAVWSYFRTCSHSICANASSTVSYLSGAAFDSGTHWLVMRFDFASAATTNVTMWLDPTAGAQTPSDGSALTIDGQQVVAMDALHFDWVAFGAATQSSIDELRFATTFADLQHDAVAAVGPDGASPPPLWLSAGPNPSPDVSTLRFSLSVAQAVDVRILDVAGRLVRSLTAGMMPGGEQTLHWDGRDEQGIPSNAGLYFVHLRTETGERIVKVVRLR